MVSDVLLLRLIVAEGRLYLAANKARSQSPDACARFLSLPFFSSKAPEIDGVGRLTRAFGFRAIATKPKISILSPHGNYGSCGGLPSTGVSPPARPPGGLVGQAKRKWTLFQGKRPPHLRRGSFFNCRRIRRQDPMQETALCAHKHFRGVGEPIGLEECQRLRVQQSVASIETIVTAVFTRELDTAQHDFGFFFHGCDGVLWMASFFSA